MHIYRTCQGIEKTFKEHYLCVCCKVVLNETTLSAALGRLPPLHKGGELSYGIGAGSILI